MEKDNILMSEQEVFDILKFAQYSTDGFSQRMGLGVYTPDLVNQTLKQLNVNPLEPTEKKISSALGDPNNNEEELVGYSEWYNINNMLYKRTNGYLGNMLSFDLQIKCDNAHGADYNSKEYKEDKERVYKWLRKFNYKREFRNIVNNMLRQETVFTSLREEGRSYALQQLPSDYCKMTRYIPETKSFDFNCYYFLTPGVDIDQYAPIFKKYYLDVMKGQGINDYFPSSPMTISNGSFVLWHQTTPREGFWTWKFAPEIFTKIPYLAPMMQDSQRTNLLRKLQTNKDLASARALVLGEIGFLDKTKSGQVPDQLNLSPESLSFFMQLLKSGLEQVWNVGGVPLTNTKKHQFEDTNKDMYSTHLKELAGQSVSMSRILYNTDKMSETEAIIALNTDANLMKSLYIQFEDFLKYYVNRKTKKYKFSFIFEGIEYPRDREDRLGRALEVADRGIVLPSMISSALGISPMDFDSMMDEAKHSGFSEQLTQLLSIHTATGGEDGKRGRPLKKRVSTESRDYD